MELIFEATVSTFPSLDPWPIHLVFEGLPAEHSLLEDLLQNLVAFEFLLTGVLLIILHVVVQVDPDAGTVHSFPDVLEAEINDIFKLFLFDGGQVMELHLCLLLVLHGELVLVSDRFLSNGALLVEDEEPLHPIEHRVAALGHQEQELWIVSAHSDLHQALRRRKRLFQIWDESVVVGGDELSDLPLLKLLVVCFTTEAAERAED